METQKENLYLIIAIIVGVVAIGIVAFTLGKYSNDIATNDFELEKNGNEIIKPLIEKETEKSETVSEITNLKTYQNTKANFTFQYPKDWKVISEYFYETASGIKSKKLTVTLGKNEKEEISINLRQAQCNAPCKCKEVGENIIQTCSQNSETLKTFNQIVSTFEIDEVDETADWEIYRNDEYGYEIKYPKDWNYSKDVLSDWFGKKFVKNDNEFICKFSVSMILTEKFDNYMESYYQKTPKLVKVNINEIPASKEGELPNLCNYWIKKQSGSEYSFQITQAIEKIITDKDGNKVSYGYVNDSECTDILSNILSTFKFTE